MNIIFLGKTFSTSVLPVSTLWISVLYICCDLIAYRHLLLQCLSLVYTAVVQQCSRDFCRVILGLLLLSNGNFSSPVLQEDQTTGRNQRDTLMLENILVSVHPCGTNFCMYTCSLWQ